MATKQHQAAVCNTPGTTLSLVNRDTPSPGPNEILIQTKAIAVNPVDYYQRDKGMPPVPIFPAVLGSDVAGVVAKVGSNVVDGPPLGSRVLALATNFYHGGSPDHGAFQEFTLAPAEAVTSLPDALSYEEGSVLPLAVLTALSGYTSIGIPIDTKLSPSDNQAILIWGASSSVGSLAVQSAKILGFSVFATAGAHNLEYVKKLGADAVFDYKSSNVVQDIANKVKEDGVNLLTAHVIVNGGLQPTLDVLALTKGEERAKVAHAALLPENHPTLDGTEIIFTFPPTDADQRSEHMHKCFKIWLRDALQSGRIVPSPRIQVVDGGLDNLNEALNLLSAGVSGTKLVVTV